uniref:NadR/Ttd14 AAA domain-containing protein n=1 Tax=viral metagenome TaxID=1070528 RepID=A0A6C0ECJ7_9ZZZZ
MDTKVVNIVAGPGSGKSTISALLFSHLKMKKCTAEYVQEFAKTLVWTSQFEALNDQYYVTRKQKELLEAISGNVEYIVTDGSLLHGLFYNRFNEHNTSNIDKTEQYILENFKKFNNIVIFLDRQDIPYEQAGRYQGEKEAKAIDTTLKMLLDKNGIKYKVFPADTEKISDFVDYVLNYKFY